MENLKKLWHTVFGDAPSIIDAYFDTFYDEALTAVEFVDGKLAAAAYVMPAGYLVNGERREKCAHIYAVAVYPEFRGRGLGVSVTNKAVELAEKAGFTAIVLHPAEDSLFGYYEKHCGFSTCFSANIRAASLAPSDSLKETDTKTYREKREQLLQKIPHVDLSCEVLDFFQKCGGKLYVSDESCAAAESFDNMTYIREALGKTAEVPLSDNGKYTVCTVGENIATGMIYGNRDFDNAWMGLTLE